MNIDLEAASFWLIGYCVFMPFIVAGAVAIYYRWRYREGICSQRYFDRGLLK